MRSLSGPAALFLLMATVVAAQQPGPLPHPVTNNAVAAGPVGRLAATTQVVRARLYLFGGYTVDSAGGEKSVPAVDQYDTETGRWSARAPIPVPVDDAVSGVYRDSLVFIVSGWHDTDNVQDVQVHDVVLDRWSAATPIPGRGVFGHTGEIAGDAIVYVGGMRAVQRVSADVVAIALPSCDR